MITFSRLHRPHQALAGMLGFLLVVTLFFAETVLAQSTPCEQAAKQLRGTLQSSQSSGGIWGYMEKANSLKGESMLGFQVDGKLARLVTHWDSLCKDSDKPPKETYDLINDNLDKAVEIVNKTPGRTPPDKLLEMIKDLNKSLDAAHKKLGL